MIPTPPILPTVASFVAQKPVNVACDTDVNPGTIAPPFGFTVEAWTPYGGDTVHMAPNLCEAITAPVGSDEFAAGLRVIVHEATHAKGEKREACAEYNADYLSYQVLSQIWGFQSLDPWAYNAVVGRIHDQIMALTRQRPANYQPEGCPDYARG
jgi:hypothetical protein